MAEVPGKDHEQESSPPFSLPAAVPSSAHSSSRHSYGRCFPTHHRLRCSVGMEHARETLPGLEDGQGQWGICMSSGDLNPKKVCKFLHQIWGNCTFWVAYNLIKPGETFHRDGKKDTFDRKATISYCILNLCYKALGSMETRAFKNH